MANVFDPVRPTMHYKLRMWRADEYQVSLNGLCVISLGRSKTCEERDKLIEPKSAASCHM
jgi:hypothetical protein